MHSETF